MKYGSFVLLVCSAMLSAGCGSDATNRTANKPIVEDRTRDAQPVGGAQTDSNPNSGAVIPDRVPTPNQPNAGADPAAVTMPPTGVPPTSTVPPANDTAPPIDPPPVPKRETPAPVIP